MTEPPIDTAYRVFASYRIGARIDFAPRPGASKDEVALLPRLLTRMPPRALPIEAIDAYFEYVDAAHYQGGFDADEFRYFLPRALELIALGEATPWLRDYLDRALERGRARETWPAEQWQAVARALACGAD